MSSSSANRYTWQEQEWEGMWSQTVHDSYTGGGQQVAVGNLLSSLEPLFQSRGSSKPSFVYETLAQVRPNWSSYLFSLIQKLLGKGCFPKDPSHFVWGIWFLSWTMSFSYIQSPRKQRLRQPGSTILCLKCESDWMLLEWSGDLLSLATPILLR